MLPLKLIEPIKNQLRWMQRVNTADLKKGAGFVRFSSLGDPLPPPGGRGASVFYVAEPDRSVGPAHRPDRTDRCRREDLRKTLPGYNEYVKKVRYRLVPFVW